MTHRAGTETDLTWPRWARWAVGVTTTVATVILAASDMWWWALGVFLGGVLIYAVVATFLPAVDDIEAAEDMLDADDDREHPRWMR